MGTVKTDQTGWMPRLIRVFAVGTAIFLVLSCPGSNDWQRKSKNQSVTSTNLLLSVNFHGDALQIIFELPHDQTNNMTCASSEDSDQTKPIKWNMRPAKTQISLGIGPVWSEYSLSTWRKLGSLATHLAHREDSDQTGPMPRLIWVFAGRIYHFIGFVMRWLKWHVHLSLMKKTI